jgi:glycine dehydrogenase subunit 2
VAASIFPISLSRKIASAVSAVHRSAFPALSEPETMRHYVRLSQRNASIDASLYPLGSCTMKHNPRLNEKMARLAGFRPTSIRFSRARRVQGRAAHVAELSRG